MQLSASNAHAKARQDARSVSSVSTKSHATGQPDIDPMLSKELMEVGAKIFALCIPWPLWAVSGDFLMEILCEQDGSIIVDTNEDFRKDVLSYVPNTIIADFLSRSGQAFVSPLNPDPNFTNIQITPRSKPG